MIGIDLVNVEEFRHEISKGGEAFLHRAFTEVELAHREVTHLAGLWAAKEAVVKAAPGHVASLLDVILTYDPDGRPRARVDVQEFELSISHHGDYAVAVAMLVAR